MSVGARFPVRTGKTPRGCDRSVVGGDCEQSGEKANRCADGQTILLRHCANSLQRASSTRMFLHPVDDLVDPTEFFLLRFGPQCAANRAFDFAGDAKMTDKVMSARFSSGTSMQLLEMGAGSCQQHQVASRDRVKFTLRKPGRWRRRLAQPRRGLFLRRRAFFSNTAQTAAVSCAPRPLASAAL